MLSESEKIKILIREMKKISSKNINIMEVCGTHTMSIARYGILSMLPENVRVISGPGCPVCVTSARDIHLGIELARRPKTLVATFGDMLKVPSQGESLQNFKNVRVVYSPLQALQLARENTELQVVFLGIGFETTAPLVAATIKVAAEERLKNFSVLSSHKVVPPALKVILENKECTINGLLLPGHVSAITGCSYFDFLKDYKVNGVVAGFQALEIMESIYLIIKHLSKEVYSITNNYEKIVTEKGNELAWETLNNIFKPGNSEWRGIGEIPGSGLHIRDEYSDFCAEKRFELSSVPKIKDPAGCLCGGILTGKFRPTDCRHFGKSCTPAEPVGPCMVSSEGTCAAFYKYHA